MTKTKFLLLAAVILPLAFADGGNRDREHDGHATNNISVRGNVPEIGTGMESVVGGLGIAGIILMIAANRKVKG